MDFNHLRISSALKAYGAWYVFGVVGMAIFMALFYQVAWQYPVVDSFPLIERIRNPQFLLNDFYTNTLVDYSPRKNIAHFIVFGSELFDVSHHYFIGWLNVVRIFVFSIGLYFLYSGLTREKSVSFVAFYLSCLSFLAVPNLPAWWPITYDLTASSLSGMFAVIAWACVVRAKVVVCLLLLTASVFYHPLVGVQSTLLAIVLFVALYGWKALLPLFRSPRIYVAGSVLLAVFLWVYLPYEKVVDDQSFIAINAQFKHSHHFFSTHIEAVKWVGLLIYMSGFFYFFLRVGIKSHTNPVSDVGGVNGHELTNLGSNKFFIPLLVYVAAMFFVNFLWVDIYPNRTAISFIPFRAVTILVPVFVLCLARYMVMSFQEKRYTSFLMCHFPFLPYDHVGLTWFIFPDAPPLTLPLLVFCLVFILIVFCDHLKNIFSSIDHVIGQVVEKFCASKIEKAMFPVFSLAVLFSVVRFELDIPTLDNQPAIYRWISENTRSDAIVLGELNAVNNQNFRLLTERAVVVSKDFPFAERHYQEWYQRYRDVYEYQPVSRGRVDKRSADELQQVMNKYGASILIRTKMLEANHHFEEIGRAAGEKSQAIVYRLRDNNKLSAHDR